jgi:putative ABC transport system permease protein
MRPFFRDALPSLTFFVLEAGFVCAAFLATLVLVPDLVRRLGSLAVRLVPGGPAAERLLTRRRVEHLGHELAWSVSGVMLVFALLLALHIATFALKQEVVGWADVALGDELYVLPVDEGGRAADVLGALTPELGPWPQARAGSPPLAIARFSGTTRWPDAIRAAVPEELAALAEARGRPDLAALARRLGPGRMLLSRMMAERFRVGAGDLLEVSGRGGTRRLQIVGVSDGIGFLPIQGPYRNTKTYGIVSAADADLIAPYVAPIGAAVAIADGTRPEVVSWWRPLVRDRYRHHALFLEEARRFRRHRLRETDRDFVIFDLILLLTSALAALGIANQLVLSVQSRQREIALYRVLGMSAGQVRRLVLLEGAFVGLVGGALAALLGVPLGYAAIGALQAVSAFAVDFHLPPVYVVATVLGAFAVAVLASLHPASRAARTDAAQSIHYE